MHYVLIEHYMIATKQRLRLTQGGFDYSRITHTVKDKVRRVSDFYARAMDDAGGYVQERDGATRIENIYRTTFRRVFAFAEYALLQGRYTGITVDRQRAGEACRAGLATGLFIAAAPLVAGTVIAEYSGYAMGAVALGNLGKTLSQKKERDELRTYGEDAFMGALYGTAVSLIPNKIVATLLSATNMGMLRGIDRMIREESFKKDNTLRLQTLLRVKNFFRGAMWTSMGVSLFRAVSTNVTVVKAQEGTPLAPQCIDTTLGEVNSCVCATDKIELVKVAPRETVWGIIEQKNIPWLENTQPVDAGKTKIILDLIRKFPQSFHILTYPDAMKPNHGNLLMPGDHIALPNQVTVLPQTCSSLPPETVHALQVQAPLGIAPTSEAVQGNYPTTTGSSGGNYLGLAMVTAALVVTGWTALMRGSFDKAKDRVARHTPEKKETKVEGKKIK